MNRAEKAHTSSEINSAETLLKMLVFYMEHKQNACKGRFLYVGSLGSFPGYKTSISPCKSSNEQLLQVQAAVLFQIGKLFFT